MKTFGWLEVELIGELLAERHPTTQPFQVSFPQLKALVEALPGFKEEPGHPANERILEEIQRFWSEELEEKNDEP